MKILMLTPYLPFPLLTGGQTRSFNLIKRLSSLGHEITLFCLVKNAEEKNYVNELEKYCQEVKIFRRPEKPWTIGNILGTGLSFFPFLVIRNWADGEKKAIEEKLKKEKFDLIHAETFYVMPHIPKTTIPILLVEQTIEYLVYRHFAEDFKYFFLKPLLLLDVSKMKYWELKYWSIASLVAAMSLDDKKIMLSQNPNLKVDIVPNGVDSKYFSKKVTDRSSDPIILYVGNFTWLQNREAVQVLVNDVWPLIKEKLSKAKLWIVGKSAKNFFPNIESESIKVEEVKDIREAYQKATLLVAPIYGGGGTRYKNFEAFASGLPVVTTSIGIRGTDAHDGKEVVIRDSPKDIAKAVVALINDKKLYGHIAQNARRMVSQMYDWNPIALRLSNIYKELGRS
ncbi:glycosyltransferase family 4 protein [Candidatus Daviesbacteria bacterium]|nr:glycosyltransferase family 4 protein [Candidatus Daviesbacteria bacterium]